MTDENTVTYFAETDFRNKKTRFGIKAKDRARHMYVIGKTGMGKSTILQNMAVQDIQNGEGLAVMDPHGNMAEDVLNYIPEHRIKDVVYFAPFDIDYPVSFNVMEDIGADKRHLVASGLMSSFKKIWVDAWSARMEYILNNILLALLEYPGSTLLGVNRMLADKDYRKKVVENVKDPSVRSFWVDEFAKYGDRYMQEAGAAIQNKIGQFTANPIIRNIIGQPTSSFDIRKMMDQKKILLINLSKGKVGEQNAALLGGMLITKIYLAAMSRADTSSVGIKDLPHFYFYVDEFQSFASDSFADILSEARKYKLSLVVAHQYVEQMSEEVRAAIFGNVGTMVVYRVGSFDAEIFEKEFSPEFTAEDIVNLGLYQMYLRLMIDGVGSKPFSARGMPPIPEPPVNFRDQIIASSREVSARPRKDVEEEIRLWHEPIATPKYEPKDRDSRDNRGEFPNSNSQNNSQGFRPSQQREQQQPYPPKRYDAPRSSPPPPQSSYQKPAQPIQSAPTPKPPVSAPSTPPPPPPMPKALPTKTAPSLKLKSILAELENEEASLPMRSTLPPPPPARPTQSSQESVPLSTLKSPTMRKTPTPEHVSALKNVLANAIKNHVPPPAPKPAPVITREKKENPVPSPIPEKNNAPQEVSEEVLRKILE